MGPGAVIYVPSLIDIGSGIQNLMGDTQTHTHRHQRNLIAYLIFFNKESRLKMVRTHFKNDNRQTLKDMTKL
jgi:hypothetical protein